MPAFQVLLPCHEINDCLFRKLLWCKAWNGLSKLLHPVHFPDDLFSQFVSTHTAVQQISGQCWERNNIVYQNTAQRVATYIKY